MVWIFEIDRGNLDEFKFNLSLKRFIKNQSSKAFRFVTYHFPTPNYFIISYNFKNKEKKLVRVDNIDKYLGHLSLFVNQ